MCFSPFLLSNYYFSRIVDKKLTSWSEIIVFPLWVKYLPENAIIPQNTNNCECKFSQNCHEFCCFKKRFDNLEYALLKNRVFINFLFWLINLPTIYKLCKNALPMSTFNQNQLPLHVSFHWTWTEDKIIIQYQEIDVELISSLLNPSPKMPFWVLLISWNLKFEI